MMPYCDYYHKIISIFGRDFVYHCRRPAKHLKVINFNQIAACEKHANWYYAEIRMRED